MAKRKAMSQSQVVKEMVRRTELDAKTVRTFFAELSDLVQTEINPRSKVAPGVCQIPGICRVKTRKKPARKARKGINPFTGEEMMFKAKPASVGVRILPVKKLKDAVNKK